MIKISVIIPAYNMENYLRECLDSVLGQTIKDIEIICIDDGSTDNSYEILLEYNKKYENVIVLQQKNQGSGSARNRGMEHANGRYVCFMDADDYYAKPQALEQLFLAAEKNGVLVCGGNKELLYGEKKMKHDVPFNEEKKIVFKYYGNFYDYTRYIIRTDVIRKNNILFPSYRRYQDPPFLLNVMIHAQEFYAVNELVYIVRKGYKEVKYTLEVTLDLLQGIRDCFKMAYENDLLVAYERYLKYVLFSYLPAIYKYADQGRVWELIDEINKISMKWVSEISDIFLNRSALDEYVIKLKEKRDCLVAKCHEAKEVVIYGAGVAGKLFLEKYKKECSRLAGFAISKKDVDESFINGYPLKEISEYDKDAFVVVVANQKNAEEMMRNLEKLDYKNLFYIEYTGLKMLEEL
ncbi:glycosyltransferase family 2 protein [Parablautia intestinalis]|uniref:Glycosyltransferase family 2 protein n=1 Tax=Parablautia intestinalis TaxID=2320100 RepID=A0A3A9A8W6_9FIRM|nr:glycosyltransferase family 2 protein [Parablautia intestinalis]RKI87614.1 glycosyltransferase family 2 protein [Parablautia intestinalis]